MQSNNAHIFAIASIGLGVINLCAWILPICGLPLAVIGLVLGIVGRNSERRTLALFGIILAGIGLTLGAINAAWGAYLGLTGQYFQ